MLYRTVANAKTGPVPLQTKRSDEMSFYDGNGDGRHSGSKKNVPINHLCFGKAA